MKNLTLILLLTLSFISCKKDEPPQTTTQPPTTNNQPSYVFTWDLDGISMSSVQTSSSIVSNRLSSAGFTDMEVGLSTFVIIRINNPAIGIYNLPDSSSILTIGTDPSIQLGIPNGIGQNASPFYTNQTGILIGTNNGEIELTKVDYVNKLVSGTFHGRVAFNYDSSMVHEITNGVFTDIPFL